GASGDCEIARTVSRSVNMPSSRAPSITSMEPTRCWAIRATASPTVVEGWTVKSVSFMTSRTVAITTDSMPGRGGIGKAASTAVARRIKTTSTPSARAHSGREDVRRVGEDRAGGRIHGGGVAGEGKRRGGEHPWNHNQRPAVVAKAQSPGLGDDPNDHKCGRMPAAQDSDDQQSEASRERRHEGRLHRDAC